MSASLDPDEWVDAEEVFGDDYDPEAGITRAEFTLIPYEGVYRLLLVFKADGVRLRGEKPEMSWGLSFYSAYRINAAIPIPRDHAKLILSKLSGTNDFADYDWAEKDWTYFE